MLDAGPWRRESPGGFPRNPLLDPAMATTEKTPNEMTGPSQPARTVEAAVAAHAFLRGLSVDALRALAGNAMFVSYAAGEQIFRENDPANRFYLIERGRVALESRREGNGTALIQIIGPGDVLGWSWLFPPYVWQFDARALEPVEAIFFYGTRLREQCEQDHKLGHELLKRVVAVVIQRLQSARTKLLAGRKANGRDPKREA
jgi:CRP/FNR family cyclic AMP-dependent transcriptional regulator